MLESTLDDLIGAGVDELAPRTEEGPSRPLVAHGPRHCSAPSGSSKLHSHAAGPASLAPHATAISPNWKTWLSSWKKAEVKESKSGRDACFLCGASVSPKRFAKTFLF